MTATCPNGHVSAAEDFCDTCGAKIDPAARSGPEASGPEASGEATAPGAPPAPEVVSCPNCSTDNVPDALFCEACGYDFTTGALPRGAQPPGQGEAAIAAPAGEATGIPPGIPPGWVAEVWVDPDWYAGQDAEEQCPSPGLPSVVPLTARSALVGRVSASRNIHPDIDCTTDSGVSRRHAQLTTDGRRWFVEDLGSSNGTFVGPAAGPLPEDPIPVGPKKELQDDERIYVGAWTRIVIREATDEEKESGTG